MKDNNKKIKKARKGRHHKFYVYVGFDSPEELPHYEVNCKFTQGMGTIADVMADMIRQASATLDEDKKEVLKKAALETVVQAINKA